MIKARDVPKVTFDTSLLTINSNLKKPLLYEKKLTNLYIYYL